MLGVKFRVFFLISNCFLQESMVVALRECEQNCEEKQKALLEEERKKSDRVLEAALADDKMKMESFIADIKVKTFFY